MTKTVMMYRLNRIWAKMPSLRLGQLIENAYSNYDGATPLFYMPDEMLLELIEKYVEEHGRK